MKRILYLQYTNPGGYPPLEHSSRILADAGWQVLFLGTGAVGASGLRFPSHERITVRQWEFQPAGWRQKLHYVWFCLWCFGWALRWRPSWIYASDMLSCVPVLLVSRILHVPVVYHEHDSPSHERKSVFIRTCLLARSACARRAKLCVLPNLQRAERFVAETAPRSPVKIIWNCPAYSDVVRGGDSRRGGLRLLYHGSISRELIPDSILDVLSTLPADVSLTVVGYETIGSRGYLNDLRAKASKLELGNRFTAIGPVSRSELLKICRCHDVGLALMPKRGPNWNLRTLTGASNKAFDYLACGLALVVSDLPDWQQMFVDPGYGLCCNPDAPESIAMTIRYLYENPDVRRSMAKKGQDKILNEWNYETQFQPVLQFLRCS